MYVVLSDVLYHPHDSNRPEVCDRVPTPFSGCVWYRYEILKPGVAHSP